MIKTMHGFPPQRDSQVTFANYAQHPFSRWGFQNIDAVMHTAMIPRGGDLPIMPEDFDSDLSTQHFIDASGEKLILDDLLTKNDADAFLVMRNNKIVYEKYLNGFTPHKRHIWYSMTKSLVSVAFGILKKDFDIDLNASPSKYITELSGSGFERTTIQDVLNHASAIDFKENYVDIDSDFIQHYAPAIGMAYIPGAQDVQPDNTDIFGIYDFLEKFVNEEQGQTPGVTFEYNSANADVIGWLISRLSNMSLQDFLAKHIWMKLGTYHDAAIVVDRAGMPVATGGMTSTLRDAALFGQLLLNNGKVNDESIIPETWVNEILNLDEKDASRFTNNQLYKNEFWQYYKNMWWILDPVKQEFAAVGIHGQVIYINRSTNTVIAQFSSQAGAGQVGSIQFRSKILAIRKIGCG
ncbi:MAG: CubicO group peptidase (beta-lactamase class C family) [Candidatus Azotimanducaceae bacterium]|jgi:CubicO group peptidase (beta-lactamase class C family)